jgi:hypothetical protein
LFRCVEGINEAKKIYKELAKKLHPDVGGSEEEFKALNTIYTHLIEHKIYFTNEIKIDVELEKIISLILHFENITIELVGSWIWVSGDTKEIKEKLKELGFKWASKKKMWYYGEMKGSMETILFLIFFIAFSSYLWFIFFDDDSDSDDDFWMWLFLWYWFFDDDDK